MQPVSQLRDLSVSSYHSYDASFSPMFPTTIIDPTTRSGLKGDEVVEVKVEVKGVEVEGVKVEIEGDKVEVEVEVVEVEAVEVEVEVEVVEVEIKGGEVVEVEVVEVEAVKVECYASYPISSSHASLMLLTYHICTTGPSLLFTGLTSDFAAI
jgi:hypothetical protein